MPSKKHIHALPQYMSEYKRQGRAMYKYQRRVPKALHCVLERKKWDLSLGSDLKDATVRALEYADKHNRLLENLASQEAKEAYTRKLDSAEAAFFVDLALNYADAPKLAFDGKDYVFDDDISNVVGIKLDGSKEDQELWRSTEERLRYSESLPKRQARDHLAHFAAYAFDDRTHLDRLDADDPFGEKLVELLMPVPPTDLGGVAVFEALKGALDARLFELDSEIGADNRNVLSELRERYFDLRGLTEETKSGYISKTNSLISKVGDLPLTQYTPEKLRTWRDSLMTNGLSPRSIAAYFTALKAIMRWALQEDLVPGFNTMPTDKVTMPRPEDSVEEIRWQRFDDDEIKRVWALLEDGWGAKSRFSEERRSAFKMVFRVLLHTGLRPVEVFRLRPEDVTRDLIHASKVKTKIPRYIPVSTHIADFYDFMQVKPFPFDEFGKASSAADKMSDSFTKIIRNGGFNNSRHVLYSTKDTLVDRLQRAGHSDDVIRGFTGHVSGQGRLRHYKTRLNDSPEGLSILRKAIDAVSYW